MKPVAIHWNQVTTNQQGEPYSETIEYKVFCALNAVAYPSTPTLVTSTPNAVLVMPTAGVHKVAVVASGPDGDSPMSSNLLFTAVPNIPATPTGLAIG